MCCVLEDCSAGFGIGDTSALYISSHEAVWRKGTTQAIMDWAMADWG